MHHKPNTRFLGACATECPAARYDRLASSETLSWRSRSCPWHGARSCAQPSSRPKPGDRAGDARIRPAAPSSCVNLSWYWTMLPSSEWYYLFDLSPCHPAASKYSGRRRQVGLPTDSLFVRIIPLPDHLSIGSWTEWSECCQVLSFSSPVLRDARLSPPELREKRRMATSRAETRTRQIIVLIKKQLGIHSSGPHARYHQLLKRPAPDRA